MKHKHWIEGPKWAKIPNFLRKVAFTNDVKICITTSGILRETVFYELEGSRENVERAMKEIEDVLIENNAVFE